nr:hypothetical protein [uncultured Allomuricauda sp.]
MEKIVDEYKNQLEKISDEELSDFTTVDRAIKISRKCLQQLRIVIRNGSFMNKENEIRFFKRQKPFIYGNLKFYVKLYKYLLQKPKGGNAGHSIPPSPDRIEHPQN